MTFGLLIVTRGALSGFPDHEIKEPENGIYNLQVSAEGSLFILNEVSLPGDKFKISFSSRITAFCIAN